ncbi:MAG TPA: VanZ family protein [Rhodocyclaceae bacterium]|nr:VanZ family protein [Rhodocyclaceae bacterium]
MPHHARSHLALQLALAYTALVVYASLHPFSGWRDTGVDPLEFLTASWPRYFTVFDLSTNVLAYLPLGFLWVAYFQTPQQRWPAALLVTLTGALLSLGLETVQNYLPSRVSSNLDLGCNALGTVLGAALGVWRGRLLLNGGRWHVLRNHWCLPGNSGDAGLTLMGLWLLTQLNPEILLFGNGDLRQLLELEDAMAFDVDRFSRIETFIAAANTLAVGLAASCLLLRRQWAGVLLLMGAALLVHTFAAAILVSPQQALRWITPGNIQGVAVGLVLLLPSLQLSLTLRRVLAGSALLFATVLVNLSPTNPYLSQAAQMWWQGHFLNFNGLTRLTSMLWPFLALPWLLLPQRERTFHE